MCVRDVNCVVLASTTLLFHARLGFVDEPLAPPVPPGGASVQHRATANAAAAEAARETGAQRKLTKGAAEADTAPCEAVDVRRASGHARVLG